MNTGYGIHSQYCNSPCNSSHPQFTPPVLASRISEFPTTYLTRREGSVLSSILLLIISDNCASASRTMAIASVSTRRPADGRIVLTKFSQPRSPVNLRNRFYQEQYVGLSKNMQRFHIAIQKHAQYSHQ